MIASLTIGLMTSSFTACKSDEVSSSKSGAGGGGGSQGGASGSAGSQGGTSGKGAGAAGGGAGAGGTAGTSSGGTSGSAGAGGGGTGGAGGSGGSAGTGAAPGAPEVRFIGRPDRREAGVVRLAWSGSTIAFRFSGTEASVRLDDRAGFFTVVLDGQKQADLLTTSGEKLYPLASGLQDGPHELSIHRRTEANRGLTRFLGVELGSNGKLLAPTPPSSRRIELIGDSISCGYGNEGADQYCPFTPETENHYLAYGTIASRSLNADLVTVAWSGKGVIYNYGDDKNEPLPALYERALPQDASSTWDFSQWQPHVVVINLGTNDFSTDGDPTEPVFGAAYRGLLVRVRSNYPDAWIVCLAPTGLGGSELATAKSYMTNVVSALVAAGDTKLKVTELSFQETGAGCDYHPSLATHASMAAALTTELKSVLGW